MIQKINKAIKQMSYCPKEFELYEMDGGLYVNFGSDLYIGNNPAVIRKVINYLYFKGFRLNILKSHHDSEYSDSSKNKKYLFQTISLKREYYNKFKNCYFIPKEKVRFTEQEHEILKMLPEDAVNQWSYVKLV